MAALSIQHHICPPKRRQLGHRKTWVQQQQLKKRLLTIQADIGSQGRTIDKPDKIGILIPNTLDVQSQSARIKSAKSLVLSLTITHVGSRAPIIMPNENIVKKDVMPRGELPNATRTCHGDNSTPDSLAFSAVVKCMKGDTSTSLDMMTCPSTTFG